MKFALTFGMLLVLLVMPHDVAYAVPQEGQMFEYLSPQKGSVAEPRRTRRERDGRDFRHEDRTGHRFAAGPRPGRWCGWWMRTQYGGGAEYNLARNWAKRGSPSGPQVGAVVVWRGHVGVITGKASNGKWVVKSGNDGGRVRERARSVAGAIAFRVL